MRRHPAHPLRILFAVAALGPAAADAIDEYRLDDGVKEIGIGIQATGSNSIAWLNRFVVSAGNETVTAVRLAFGADPLASDNIPDGTPVTVHLWYDFNQDGDPGDAVVLASGQGVVANSGTNAFNTVPLALPVTLAAGEIVFAGAIVDYQGQFRVAGIDADGTDSIPPYPPNDHAFLAGSNNGMAVDPTALALAQFPVAPVRSALFGGNGDGTWLVRLNAHGVAAPLPVVTPPTLDMGAVDIDASSPPRTVSLTNAGTGLWQVLALLPSPLPDGFQSLPGTCGLPPFALAPGQACDLQVVFAPDRHGHHVWNAELAGNTPPGSAVFQARGMGTLFADGFE